MEICKTALLVLLFMACTKQNENKELNFYALNNKAVILTDTVKTPLDDLKKNTFMGDTGGLYPGGKNLPSGKYADHLLEKSQSITPLDLNGNASAYGKIVFVSVGGSTGGHNMESLISKTQDNPSTNSYLKLINCNSGSGEASLNSVMNPDDIYWSHVKKTMSDSGTAFKQVQIVYLETDDSTKYVDFPGRPNLVKNEIETCMRTLKQKFSNLKILYVLGRTRTFGVKAIWNKEPSPYYFGWACKWAIEDQINGVPGTEYKGKDAVAPIITWGFYQWADSLPRKTDNFYWRSYETTDGLHATKQGEDTLSTRFQNFLLTDKYASMWYAAH